MCENVAYYEFFVLPNKEIRSMDDGDLHKEDKNSSICVDVLWSGRKEREGEKIKQF